MIEFEDIRFDCALYNGYKPCKYGNECRGCPYYEPLQGEPVDASHALSAPPPEMLPQDSYRVVIIKTGAMGDVLRTTTLLHPLKRAHPQSHVTWVTDPSAVPLLKANPYIDELRVLDEATDKELTRRPFHLLLCYEKDAQALQLAANIPAAVKRGFGPNMFGTPTVFNQASRYSLLLGISDPLKFRLNQQTYPHIIADMAEIPYERDPYILELTDASLRRRAEIDERIGNHDKPRVGLNTGCGPVFRTKQWTLQGWLELISYLREKADVEILLLGGPAEQEMNRAIQQHVPDVVDTRCDNSLEQFFGVVDACDIIVSSDSLAMHIAIALRKYVVALFGSTTPREVDLYDRGEKVVTEFACSPCYLKSCDKNPTCMQAMSGDVVGEAVLRGLEKVGATEVVGPAY